MDRRETEIIEILGAVDGDLAKYARETFAGAGHDRAALRAAVHDLQAAVNQMVPAMVAYTRAVEKANTWRADVLRFLATPQGLAALALVCATVAEVSSGGKVLGMVSAMALRLGGAG